MRAIILTLFPDMFPGPLGHSLPGAGLTRGDWQLETLNLRDFATDKHRRVDDTPYGGGAGMVMKPEVAARAIDAAYARLPNAQLIHLTPRGQLLDQKLVNRLTEPDKVGKISDVILLCSRFEGMDERVCEHYRPLEISIGDYVLFGGEVAAMVLLEAMLRYLPGIMGNAATHAEESFMIGEENACLLEYPHYTKPPVWEGQPVPEIMLSGHHAHIAAWRREQAERITRERRPDLWQAYQTQHRASDTIPASATKDGGTT